FLHECDGARKILFPVFDIGHALQRQRLGVFAVRRRTLGKRLQDLLRLGHVARVGGVETLVESVGRILIGQIQFRLLSRGVGVERFFLILLALAFLIVLRQRAGDGGATGDGECQCRASQHLGNGSKFHCLPLRNRASSCPRTRGGFLRLPPCWYQAQVAFKPPCK